MRIALEGSEHATHRLARVLATADQAFIGHLVYYYAIKNYGNSEVVLRAGTTW